MTSTDNAQAIIDAALRSAAPAELRRGQIYGWLTPAGHVQKIDLSGDDYSEAPARKTGHVTVRDVPSFLSYFRKHSDANSEVFADSERLTITAVLDAHTSDTARWGQHRLALSLRTTAAWGQWLARDGKLMTQDEFAEFLEDHLAELVEPSAAEMLEIAQSIQGTTKCEFQSGTRLQSGQRQLSFVETTTAKAGQRGQLTIPEVFTIALQPFEGGTGYKLNARFRYRIEGNGLRLGFKLDRPDEARRLAFEDILSAVAGAVEQPVMNGSPA
ncbi:DUF2303 family protein [Kitasatospora purpeofusca]|uniref:DUF2303 family protein n=1 Tax=Kitasatospora purpeofusca TaxID=67352 RepID=UPI0036571AA6